MMAYNLGVTNPCGNVLQSWHYKSRTGDVFLNMREIIIRVTGNMQFHATKNKAVSNSKMRKLLDQNNTCLFLRSIIKERKILCAY